MSDFGSDASGQTISLMSKLMDTLMRFLKFLIERQDKHTQSQLNKLKVNELQSKKEQKEAFAQVQRSVGLINAKMLQKSGVPITTFTIELTKDDAIRLNELFKRSGVTAALLTESGEGKKTYALMVKEQDLETVKRITDKMVMEAKIKALDERIEEIQSQGEMTDQEKLDLARLQKERSELARSDMMTFNQGQNRATFQEVCEGKKENALSFDRALNHFTDRDYSKNEPYFLCERTNPQNYIQCYSSRDTFHGKEYTKTDFTVYQNGAAVLEANDGRFEGRQRDYWSTVKQEMKAAGNLTDDLVAFSNQQEFDIYRMLFQEQQKELNGLEQTGELGRDYNTMIEQLQGQLQSIGVEIAEDSTLVDLQSGEALVLTDSLEPVEQARIAEATCIVKQIENYNKLAIMESELAIAQMEADSHPEGITEHSEAIQQLDEQTAEYSEALMEENSLKEERSRINGAQAVQDVDKVASEVHRNRYETILEEINGERVETVQLSPQQEWEQASAQIQKSIERYGNGEKVREQVLSVETKWEQAAARLQKSIDRYSDDRVDRSDVPEQTMEEWREDISVEREAMKNQDTTWQNELSFDKATPGDRDGR